MHDIRKSKQMNRDRMADVYKGLLIITVVIGHSNYSILHHVIFLFHMPLFFMISGYLLNKHQILSDGYLWRKIKKFSVPYICYMLFEYVVCRRHLSVDILKNMVWGERSRWCILVSYVLFIFFGTADIYAKAFYI